MSVVPAVFTPGINRWAGLRLKLANVQYPSLFRVVPMSGRQWLMQDMQLYPFPETTLPLTPVHLMQIRQSFSKALTPVTRTMGDICSKEDWDDDPYGILKQVIPSSAGAMADSIMHKREYDCFYNFLSVQAYSTTSPCPGSPDGVPLFSAVCPQSLYNNNTTFSNVSSNNVALSATAYYAAYTAMGDTLEPDGVKRRVATPKYLVINQSQRAIAQQLLKGDYERTTSSTQAFQGLRNAAKSDNLVLIQTPYYRKSLTTSPVNTNDGWCVFGEDHGLLFGDRVKFEADSDYDTNRRGYFWTAETRYDYGFWTHRESYSGPNA